MTQYLCSTILTFLLCSSSASESESPSPDGDQVVPSHVPSHGHNLHSEVRGLADAAWDDSEPRQPSPPPPVIAETSSQSSVPEPEPEVRPEQGENDEEEIVVSF
mgnify:CR=1 FL=1